MRNLRQLTDLVKSIDLKPSDLLLTGTKSESQVQLFYQKILLEEFATDEDAARFFFNSSTTSSKYKNLKRYFKSRLLSTIFFIEPKSTYGDYNRHYIFCSKKLFIAKILINWGIREEGINQCKKVFKRAMEVELTEFIVSSCRYLRLHYGARMGNEEKFAYYDKIFRNQQEILLAEHMAEGLYTELMIPYVKKKAFVTDTHRKAERFYDQLRPLLKKFDSPFLHFYGAYIKSLSYMSIADYPSTIKTCEEAICFFEQKPYTYITPLRVFYHTMLICYTQMKNFHKGREAADKSIALVSPGTHSWYVNNELKLILALHSRSYQVTVEIIREVIGHYKFNSMSVYIKERWQVYRAYVFFLATIGKIEMDQHELSTFRLRRFVNELNAINKDKKGLNVAILIIEISFLIIKKEYDELIDRFEAIKKYNSRYVKRNRSYRNHCFILMLLKIPASSFHRAGVERRAKPWYKKLVATSLNVTDPAHEIEIIPYEDLWEMLLEQLDSKIHKVQRNSFVE